MHLFIINSEEFQLIKSMYVIIISLLSNNKLVVGGGAIFERWAPRVYFAPVVVRGACCACLLWCALVVITEVCTAESLTGEWSSSSSLFISLSLSLALLLPLPAGDWGGGETDGRTDAERTDVPDSCLSVYHLDHGLSFYSCLSWLARRGRGSVGRRGGGMGGRMGRGASSSCAPSKCLRAWEVYFFVFTKAGIW